MTLLRKYFDYLPLIPIFWFLVTPLGGAARIHNPNFFILYLVTLPVWVLSIAALLKIRKTRKQNGKA